MVLSVIVPDKRPGMQKMLEQELQNIDSEIIYAKWPTGLARAKGDFVCLLEHDSAVSKGSIARQLEPFLNNPKFRKLAMVSPLIEFDDTKPMVLDSFGKTSYPQQPQLTRSGSIGGAIIRRTSILKNRDLLKTNLTTTSHGVSVSLWEHGLRIMIDPTSIYYSPQRFKRGVVVSVSEPLMELWIRECIT
jgi:hypothetical protein